MKDGPASPGPGFIARASTAMGAMPLFFVAIAFVLGIVGAGIFWIRPPLLLAAAAALALVCGVAALRALRLAIAPMLLLWLLLGAWCAEMEPQPAPNPQLLALSDGLLRTVEGVVVSASPVVASSKTGEEGLEAGDTDVERATDPS